MQPRLSLLLIALFGALPYVSTVKLPPIATFWPEWVAVVLAGCWLAVQRRPSAPRAPNDTRATSVAGQTTLAVPIPVLGFLGACAVLLIQLLARQPLFLGPPLIAAGVLALSTLMCLAGARVRASEDAAKLLNAWCVGLLVAMALNLVAVLLDRIGLFVYIYQLVPRPPQPRADGLIGQPNQLAALSVLAVLAGDYLWMRGRLPALGKLILGALVALVLAMAASRAGMLLWGLATVLSALALRSHPRRRFGWWLLAGHVGLFVTIQILWSTIGLASIEAGGARVLSASNHERLELLRDSWALIQLHPFSGVGYGNFMAARWSELTGSLLEPTNANAHNLIAHLLVEFGIPGAALVLVPMGWGVWRCARTAVQRRVAPEQFLAAAVVLVLALYSMFEFPLWHTYFLLPFALALGLVEQRNLDLQVNAMTPALRRLGWAMGVVLCVALAWDYHRSESLYSSLREQNQSRHTKAAGVAIQQASDVALLSAFDQWGNLMYARTLDADGAFVDQKLAVTERAMLTLTGRETIARHVAFLVAADQTSAARDLILRTRRTPGLESETRATLELLIPKVPALKAFIATLPAMSPPAVP